MADTALHAEMAHWDRLFERWLVAAGSHRPFRFTANAGPAWTVPLKPLNACQVAIVSTAGVHGIDQPPFDIDALIRMVDRLEMIRAAYEPHGMIRIGMIHEEAFPHHTEEA